VKCKPQREERFSVAFQPPDGFRQIFLIQLRRLEVQQGKEQKPLMRHGIKALHVISE
jgi:hypothetical protein